jgi:hypothetical protein
MGTVFRFTYSVFNKPRLVFSLRQNNPTGIITLALPRAQVYVPPSAKGKLAIGPLKKQQGIQQHKYSIHPSLNSVEDINILHQTMVVGNKIFETRQHTKAIKSGTSFALTYCRRCGDLLLPPHEVKAKGTHINLDSFDQLIFTLFYSVVVTAPGHIFATSDPVINVHQDVYFGIRFVVLWTYLSTRAGAYSGGLHRATLPPTNKETEKFIAGLSAQESIATFKNQSAELATDLFSRLEQDNVLPKELISIMAKNSRFFRVGSHNSPEWEDYQRYLKTRSAIT